MDIENLRQWIGKSETRTDHVTAAPLAALAATLDIDIPYPQPGDPVPPLWHWLYFLPLDKQSELAADGHAKRGGFLPPIDLPRRMWGGGRLEFHHALQVGERAQRVSRIVDVRLKEGRSGPLVFVVVRHEVENAQGVALTEEHDIVYRDHAAAAPSAGKQISTAREARWEHTVYPGDVLLFRYSALTFNGHRIHYDRRYATEEEHYPGLVVHGPLVATMLVDLVRRNLPGTTISHFEFRAVSPAFDTKPFSVCGDLDPDGKTISLWAVGEGGALVMTATARTG